MTFNEITFATQPLRRRAESILSEAMSFFLHRIVRKIERYIEIRNARRMLRELPDSTLKDIGISRCDIDAILDGRPDIANDETRRSRDWTPRIRP